MSDWTRRLQEVVEEKTGKTIVDREYVTLAEASETERRAMSKELDLLGWYVLDYVAGSPQEIRATERRKMAAQSRMVWIQDPVAGANVDLSCQFVFGRGVPKPKCNDEKVQEIVDEAWADPDNKLVLTSFPAQVALMTDLALQSNLFILIFEGDDGKVKLGLLDHDSVEDAVRDSENRLRVLYYVARRRTYGWDYNLDRPEIKSQMDQMAPGKPRVYYYKSLASTDPDTGEILSNDKEPPPQKMAEGLVYHIAINRQAEQVFGTPAMRRFVKWACHDDQTEALTDEGWLSLADLQAREHLPRVASYDQVNRRVVMAQPSELHSYDYDGDLLHFRSRRGMDLMVTPNHRMVGYSERGVWHEREASEIVSARQTYVPTAPGTDLPRTEEFVLPAVEKRKHSEPNRWREERTVRLRARAMVLRADGATQNEIAGQLGCTQPYVSLLLNGKPMRWRGVKQRHEPLALDMDAWLQYLGLYVSEGYGLGHVCQTDAGSVAEVREGVEGLGVPVTSHYEPATGRHVFSPQPAKQFGAWLEEHVGVGARNKRLPEFVFGLASEQQGTLLRALMVGDGSWHPATPERQGNYYTSSRQLADDVQRLAYLAGFDARIGRDFRERETPSGSLVSTPMYVVRVARRLFGAHGEARRALPIPTRTRYRGKVWCLTVPETGNFVTRRDGVMGLSGNSSLNDFMAARVDLTQAAAAFIMKRSVKGSPQQVAKLAAAAVSRRSDLASVSLDDPNAGTILPGPRPGSIINDSESVTTTPFNASTQAGQASQDAQMIRSQISAATGWPQHYLGDATAANLATAQALELPVLRKVEALQELFEGLIRTFVDRVIQQAVKAGTLPSELTADERAKLKAKKPENKVPEPSGDQPDSEPTQDQGEVGSNGAGPTRLQAAYEGQVEDEEDTERDLGYEFAMPSPLKRQMTDLITAIANTARTFDPNNTNVELSRTLLQIALGQGLDLPEAAAAVERILPEGYVDPLMAQAQAAQGGGGAPGGPPGLIPSGTPMPQSNFFGPGGGQGEPGQGPEGESNPYGAQGSSQDYQQNGSRSMQQAPELDDEQTRELEQLWEAEVGDVLDQLLRAAEENADASPLNGKH